jgi:FMN-dependent NADH-azoreductase
MTTLLHIDASARTARSLSRRLSEHFVSTWMASRPSDNLIVRDVGRNPPPITTELWIGSVFTPESERTNEHRHAVRASDELISELDQADIIVMGTPMYNYGMPAALKSWFDNVIRVGKTFTFDLDRGDYPLEPIMTGKTLVILSSRGEFGFEPGGARENMNHLETHIRTCASYLGVEQTHVIAIDYQEFGDERHELSVKKAYEAVPQLIERLQSKKDNTAQHGAQPRSLRSLDAAR